MRRFFKLKNLFLISFLAVAGIFSAGAFAINKQVEETPVMEEADANNSSRTIYFATTTQRNDYYTDEKYTGEGGDDRGFHSLNEVGKSGSYYIYS